MDGDWFDDWTRVLAHLTTRRRVLALLAGGVVAGRTAGQERPQSGEQVAGAEAVMAATPAATPQGTSAGTPVSTPDPNTVTGSCDGLVKHLQTHGVRIGGQDRPGEAGGVAVDYGYRVQTKKPGAPATELPATAGIPYHVVPGKPGKVCVTSPMTRIRFTLDTPITVVKWAPTHTLTPDCAKEKAAWERRVLAHEQGHVKDANAVFKKWAGKRKPWENWKVRSACGPAEEAAYAALTGGLHAIVTGMEGDSVNAGIAYHQKVGKSIEDPDCDTVCCHEGRAPCGGECCPPGTLCAGKTCRAKTAAAYPVLRIHVPADAERDQWSPQVTSTVLAGWVEVAIENGAESATELQWTCVWDWIYFGPRVKWEDLRNAGDPSQAEAQYCKTRDCHCDWMPLDPNSSGSSQDVYELRCEELHCADVETENEAVGLPNLLCLTPLPPNSDCNAGDCYLDVERVVSSAGTEGFAGCWVLPDGGACRSIVRLTPGPWVVGRDTFSTTEGLLYTEGPAYLKVAAAEITPAPVADLSITLKDSSVTGLPERLAPGRQLWQVTNQGGSPALLLINEGTSTTKLAPSACGLLLFPGRMALIVLELEARAYTMHGNFGAVALVVEE